MSYRGRKFVGFEFWSFLPFVTYTLFLFPLAEPAVEKMPNAVEIGDLAPGHDV